MFSRVRLKMCGMTEVRDIAHAVRLGVDAIGLIFYEKSARFVSLQKAKALLRDVPAFVDVVAVFVNANASAIYRVLQELPITYVQFHGDETPDFCESFGVPYIKAIPAVSAAAIQKADLDYQTARALVLDTPSQVLRGGTGEAFDWQVIPTSLSRLLIVAGGLDASNVRQALAACRPYAIDVCSGIEASAGRKDFDKMNALVQALWGHHE